MWYFQSPKIVFGEDSLQELSHIEGKRAFIVTDEVMQQLGYVLQVTEQLKLNKIDVMVYTAIEPDPSTEAVAACSEEMHEYQPDWIVGLGGGSCLDAAKAAWFLYERPDITLDAINPFEHFGLRSKAGFITIPTTSGTGADVSWGFALYDPDSREKLVRVSRELIPDLAIVDPVFVRNIPKQFTADVGMDALAHAIEAYTNTWHNDFADALAIKAIQLVFKYLPIAYHDGKNTEARERMHNAATMAGLAFGNSAIIIAHSLAHAASSIFHIHHGCIVGLFLPYTIEYNARLSPERYAEIARFMGLNISEDSEAAKLLATEIRKFARNLNQPLRLLDLEINEQELQQEMQHLVKSTLSSIELLANPRQPSAEDVENLFLYAYLGKQIDF
jgi:acetaldehyde dehydrogenase / alcohol dehydrogenase